MRHVLLLTLAEYFHGLKAVALPAVLIGSAVNPSAVGVPDFHILWTAGTVVLFDIGMALFPAFFAFCGHVGDWLSVLDDPNVTPTTPGH